MAGKDAQPFNWSDICRVLGWGDSDANVCARPLLHEDSLTLSVQKDWVCVPGGIIPRPVTVYTHSGPLPVLQAWEVQPFRGISMPRRNLTAEAKSEDEIVLTSPTIRMHLAGLGSHSPSLRSVP